MPVWSGFDLVGLEGRERDLTHAFDADRLGSGFGEVDDAAVGALSVRS
jgi:hypothetical protein